MKISKRAIELAKQLEYSDILYEQVVRPSVPESFMEVAFKVSKRSPDAQTKHGCVITLNDRILSTGYNGYPRDIDYSLLPNTRPEKHFWFLHSERNALAWCEKRPLGGTAYVTGECCNDCLMALWQHGIIKVYEAERHGTFLINEKTRLVRELFVELTGIEIIKMDCSNFV